MFKFKDIKNFDSKQVVFLSCVGFFITTFILSSMLNQIDFVVGMVAIGYGTLLFGVGKAFLDVIQEFWGVRSRKLTIIIAGLVRAAFFVLIAIGLSVGTYSEATGAMLGGVMRTMIWGEIILFIGQYFVDPKVYSFMARKFKGKTPLLRGVISNTLSSIVTGPIFAYGAFWGLKPDAIVHKLAWTKWIPQLPFTALAAAIAAVVIFTLRKRGWESMVERQGKDLE